MTCNCGHARWRHQGKGGRCREWLPDDGPLPAPGEFWPPPRPCPCLAYDDSVLPEAGERLEFGRHRQLSPDAETAPAWTPKTDAQREGAYLRGLKRAVQ